MDWNSLCNWKWIESGLELQYKLVPPPSWKLFLPEKRRGGGSKQIACFSLVSMCKKSVMTILCSAGMREAKSSIFSFVCIMFITLVTLYHFTSSIELNEAPLVKTAASLFRRSCYKGRESTIAGIICAGWDKRDGGQVRMEARRIRGEWGHEG